MKKTFAILLAALLLALSLVSCGGKAFNYMQEDLTPYVSAGAFKNLTVTYPAVQEITDEDVKNHAAEHVAHMEEEPETVTGRPAAMGDVVEIDYVGTMDGEEFEGGSAEGGSLLLGSSTMIDGFEEGIVGMNVEETKTIDVTFPEDYHSEDLAGKAAQFEITLNKIYAESVFEATRKELEENRVTEIENTKHQYAWTAVVNNATFVGYPEAAVEKMANDLYAYYEAAYYQYLQWGLTLENLGITKESCVETAKSIMKEELIVYAIAKANGYTVSDAEYAAKVQALAEANEVSAAEYASTYSRQSVETKVLYEKIMADVMATATFVEK